MIFPTYSNLIEKIYGGHVSWKLTSVCVAASVIVISLLALSVDFFNFVAFSVNLFWWIHLKSRKIQFPTSWIYRIHYFISLGLTICFGFFSIVSFGIIGGVVSLIVGAVGGFYLIDYFENVAISNLEALQFPWKNIQSLSPTKYKKSIEELGGLKPAVETLVKRVQVRGKLSNVSLVQKTVFSTRLIKLLGLQTNIAPSGAVKECIDASFYKDDSQQALSYVDFYEAVTTQKPVTTNTNYMMHVALYSALELILGEFESDKFKNLIWLESDYSKTTEDLHFDTLIYALKNTVSVQTE